MITASELLTLRNNVTPDVFKKFMKDNKERLNIDIINEYSKLYDEQVIQRGVYKEMNFNEHHIPGYNYAGPGTKTTTRISNNDKPINELDRVSLIHDINYYNPYMSRKQADNKMVSSLKAPLKYLADIAFKTARAVRKNKRKDENYDLYLANKKEAISKGLAKTKDFM